MSLHPQSEYPIPEQTRRIARAAFRKGTLCMRIADALGTVYQDSQFAGLFPRRGQPAEAPARLALATVRLCQVNPRSPDPGRRAIGWTVAAPVTMGHMPTISRQL